MATKNVAELIKEARKGAGLTQAELAKKVDNCTASDISKAERGEKNLTQAQLKQIAKATGVTQSSLINAPKAKKTSSSSSSSTSSSSSSSSKAKKSSMQVTATEKKVVELYRAASSTKRKAAVSVLKGESDTVGDIVNSLINSAAGGLFTNKSMPGLGGEDDFEFDFDEQEEDSAEE